jgi:hypothetical protein
MLCKSSRFPGSLDHLCRSIEIIFHIPPRLPVRDGSIYPLVI